MAAEKSNEDLIAYLDGELPDEAVAEVEQSLVEDPDVRRDVERLTRTYDLLNLLPSAKASTEFTEKTLTAIRTQPLGDEAGSKSETNASDKDRDWRKPAATWGIRAGAFMGLLLLGSIGFNGAFRRGAEPIDQLLREYPVIQRLDEYREVGDVEFLRQLNKSGLFDEPSQPGQN